MGSASKVQAHRGARRYASRANHDSGRTRKNAEIGVDLVLSDAQRRTIYALSTPPGKGGIAVVRISGPDALEVHRRIVRTSGKNKSGDPEPWKMERCRIMDPETDEALDDGLAVFFKAPKSFTTEDVLELHVHSGRAIISAVLAALGRLPFCRPAEPGEFTRRAFEGGRLDLTQAEGVKDLIDAETEVQRRVALQAAGGRLRNEYAALRQSILKCLALVEACIDFGEEDGIDKSVQDDATRRAEALCKDIQLLLADSRRGEILCSGVRLTIWGPPNAGKSSLLNFLAQREAAIVTHIPGTTRDILELSLDIGGLPVIVADTAGLRNTEDIVEVIGVQRAGEAVKNTDVSLLVLSLSDILVGSDESTTAAIPEPIARLMTPETFVLLNKVDLANAPMHPEELLHRQGVKSSGSWAVSLTSKAGTSDFMSQFAAKLRERYSVGESGPQAAFDAPVVTHARHRQHLETALQHLDMFLSYAADDFEGEVVLGAEELRYAAQAVGKISGAIGSEDVLDVIFRDFCIGK
ncbi:hypothetical protein EWM64_g3603 [Hericium alpestre]|uniref:TrmE-type G domain-containing protein n=1 Tax=Hericium alpestre TaxID=135208 RepID=A0A4Z0A007_9AGAM|nr:hypothetical protein EWM64_g3603 [Hericium alpestre]